jgi:hypothetical protein
VVLDADGVRLAASVSRAATAELGLMPGVGVLAVFKASAVRWAPVSGEALRATNAETAEELVGR